ncbi:SDR family NAD(P)-dependent oxidoreductase [Zhongshania aquimaris]|uniref:SDR family oxidoreductase n=1 Tax=Zhongshania aquimaris TaxID=2857107 RepID=A0ABS6VW23_9GAMM|nr:SDR family NAD(P)-dependent oxidoreductase [Zhongshania aquimaris]MBW2942209.1 SDR family oxidoreductase [Zhongshania aquimaris]
MSIKRFTGKVALVTGAASGIGKATALRLASEGATLMLADIDEEKLYQLRDQLHDNTVDTAIFDATDSKSCREIVHKTVSSFGRIDVVCNIAGIAGAWKLTETTEDKWRKMFAINMDSIFVICQEAIPFLIKTKGNIVNMSSVASLHGLPYNSAYCAVKAAVNGFSRSIAAEFGSDGVRVNTVSPGGVMTSIFDNFTFPENVNDELVKRMLPLPNVPLAQPEEIAALVAYVASDEARFMNGENVVIDGGQSTL